MGTISGSFCSTILRAAIVGCLSFASGAAAASEQRLTYNVHMSPYGAIGTYHTARQKNDNEVTTTTEAHIKVSLAGIVMYRLEISRLERQVAGRLVYFHGVTIENGNSVNVEGKAAGEGFVITSPKGTTTAPAAIRVMDPWSAGAPGGDMVLMPDTGEVTRVHTSGGEQSTITAGGASHQVRRYQIKTADGSEQYEVWMDGQGTPVMFNIVDRDGTTVFTLAK